jgi:hypothetical protein
MNTNITGDMSGDIQWCRFQAALRHVEEGRRPNLQRSVLKSEILKAVTVKTIIF